MWLRSLNLNRVGLNVFTVGKNCAAMQMTAAIIALGFIGARRGRVTAEEPSRTEAVPRRAFAVAGGLHRLAAMASDDLIGAVSWNTIGVQSGRAVEAPKASTLPSSQKARSPKPSGASTTVLVSSSMADPLPKFFMLLYIKTVH